MPKGGLLHAHLDATVNAAVLLKLALQQPAIHIRVLTRLTADNLKINLPEFGGLPQAEHTDFTTFVHTAVKDGHTVFVAKIFHASVCNKLKSASDASPVEHGIRLR